MSTALYLSLSLLCLLGVLADDIHVHAVETHEVLEKVGIEHRYDNSINSGHSRNKNWVLPALAALMALTGDEDAGNE